MREKKKNHPLPHSLKMGVELNCSQLNPNSNFDSTDLQKHIPTVHDEDGIEESVIRI